MTLVSTIVSLSHSLGLDVIAEGVEEIEQARMLWRLRCDQIQGFLFSKAVPFDKMSALIEERFALTP
jgi:EAL domain-containing protein (putative c-di-GMP-specific phosphodiesterase class I)